MGAIVEYFAVTKPSFTKQHLDDYFRGQFDMVWDHVVRGRGVGAKASDMTAAFCTSVKVVQDPKIKAQMALDDLLGGEDAAQMRDVFSSLLNKALKEAGGEVDTSVYRSCAFLDLAEKVHARLLELEGMKNV